MGANDNEDRGGFDLRPTQRQALRESRLAFFARLLDNWEQN
jgi:hypothetical protein